MERRTKMERRVITGEKLRRRKKKRRIY